MATRGIVVFAADRVQPMHTGARTDRFAFVEIAFVDFLLREAAQDRSLAPGTLNIEGSELNGDAQGDPRNHLARVTEPRDPWGCADGHSDAGARQRTDSAQTLVHGWCHRIEAVENGIVDAAEGDLDAAKRAVAT